MRLVFAIWLLSPLSAFPATWFVRPGVWTNVSNTTGKPVPQIGIYGTQTGTNYANAWNGIGSVAWGSNGVASGDTLYVCGTHIYKIFNDVGNGNSLGVNPIGVSGITIRMDWPGDRGTMFGGTLKSRSNFGNPYNGPDANGVYNLLLLSGATPTTFWIQNGTNIHRLKKRTAVTWTDGLGGQFFSGNTNFVQLPDGTKPDTNNTAQATTGWAFDLNNQSNITFQSCNFIEADAGPGFGAIRIPTTGSPFTIATKKITFIDCTFFDSTPFNLYPGQDSFSFFNCEFGRCSSGIYSLINGQSIGANNITVSNCFIHDTGTPEYNDGDAHAVGIQAGNFHLLTHNVTSNTGPSLVLWTGNQDMKSNVISYNVIIQSHINTSGSSAGISIGGDNSGALIGRRTGCKIIGNTIYAVDQAVGQGINLNLPDHIDVTGNTIIQPFIGIDHEVVQTGQSVNAFVETNTIINPVSRYYYFVGTYTPTNLTIDFNTYAPATSLTTDGKFYAAGITRDVHSVFLGPSSSPVAPTILTITRAN